MTLLLTRRGLLAALALALAGCAGLPAPPPSALPPIVFVHGNGDSAALWGPTIWRYESNGWPRQRLHALHLLDPSARDDDTVAQPGRTSAAQAAQALAADVDAVLARTGAAKVALVGNSRGGLIIRNYIQNFGGAAKVSHAVLGGAPNHGAWASPALRPNAEFNGAGPLLRALNAPQGPNGDEVTPGVAWMTLRSDNNDKFAQPEGSGLGMPGLPTGVTFDSPALKGALNVVLPGRDHREVSYHPEAFARTYQFITGRAPGRTSITSEANPVLDGQIGGADNRPLPGASVEVYAVDPATGLRRGAALHRRSVGADGRWGPFSTTPETFHEFVFSAPGRTTTHLYRGPFPRSTSVLHLRPEALPAADRAAGSVVLFTRPRAYFGVPRDRIVLDGITPPPGIPPGVAGVEVARVRIAEPGRAVTAEFNSGPVAERLTGRAWPAAENRVVVLEMQD